MSGNIKSVNITIIKQNVNELKKDLEEIINKGENVSDHEYQLKKRYKHLEKISPSLFNLICKEYNTTSFDKQRLNTILDLMLQQIEKIQRSQVTQHDASVEVGEHLAQTFIPQLKK